MPITFYIDIILRLRLSEMANVEHLRILRRGVDVWNEWREANPTIIPDFIGANLGEEHLNGANLARALLNKAELNDTFLIGADLSDAKMFGAYMRWAYLFDSNLSGADLRRADMIWAHLGGANLSQARMNGAILRWTNLGHADLIGTNLNEANLNRAKLKEADLSHVRLMGANLNGADLRRADLKKARLYNSILKGANLSGANLEGADLTGTMLTETDFLGANLCNACFDYAHMVETKLKSANMAGCRVCGVSAWNLSLDGATQSNLIISRKGEPVISVDDLEVAQFVCLFLQSDKIQEVINTIATRMVLILGCFRERKDVLDALRDGLNKYDYVPIIFDIKRSGGRGIANVVTSLSRISRFIIAEVDGSCNLRAEIALIIKSSPTVPILPLAINSFDESFIGIEDHLSVLKIYRYSDEERFLSEIKCRVIDLAENALEKNKRA